MIPTSCKKISENLISVANEKLTDSQIKSFESIGIDTISTFEDALFPDGTKITNWPPFNNSKSVYTKNQLETLPISDIKRLYIGSMTKAGYALVDDERYSYLLQSSGLAYIYGSKKIDKPSNYPGATCQELLYGLDCSGMIKQMGLASNFNLLLDGTINYVNKSTWNTAFKNSQDYQGLEMEDLLDLPSTQLEAGDIIVGSEVHIGMVFNNGINLAIFNSLGLPTYPCSKNSDINHGPVITKNIPESLVKSFGSDYHVLRPKIIDNKIDNSTWDVTLIYSPTDQWHADVTFFENGTTKYDEPASPGVYLTYGVWSIRDNKIHWNIGFKDSYIFDGTIEGNKMSGTYIYGSEPRTWNAIKR